MEPGEATSATGKCNGARIVGESNCIGRDVGAEITLWLEAKFFSDIFIGPTLQLGKRLDTFFNT